MILRSCILGLFWPKMILQSIFIVSTLADLAQHLREARQAARPEPQQELADRAGVNRLTVGRMENLSKGDMSVAALVRLLEARRLRPESRKAGHTRTLEDILAEQRRGELP